MLTHELICNISNKIKSTIDDEITCNQYAWWLLEAVTKQSKTNLIMQQQIDLDATQKNQLNSWIDEIVTQHKPIAYILGAVPFGPLNIKVRPPILIPRPETEEWALRIATQLQQSGARNLTILDMCTGSGCIALLLAHLLPDAHVYAVDISDEAIALAQENQKTLNINNLTIMQSDLFSALPHNLQFDLMVTNPPYGSESEYKTLDASVTQWEDKRAIVAYDNGLAIIKQIIEQAPRFIKFNQTLHNHNIKQLYIETGWRQGNVVAQLMHDHGFTAVAVEKDLAQKDRVVGGIVNVGDIGNY